MAHTTDVAAPAFRSLVNGLISFITNPANRELRAMLVAIEEPGCREHAMSPSAP